MSNTSQLSLILLFTYSLTLIFSYSLSLSLSLSFSFLLFLCLYYSIFLGVLEGIRAVELLTVGAYYKTSSTAFVTLKSRVAKITAHQMFLSHVNYSMVVKPAPNPTGSRFFTPNSNPDSLLPNMI